MASSPGIRFTRQVRYKSGPDVPGNYILDSNEDPCYENVAGLGAEYTKVSELRTRGNETAGSLF
jgi:hypothetical protein